MKVVPTAHCDCIFYMYDNDVDDVDDDDDDSDDGSSYI